MQGRPAKQTQRNAGHTACSRSTSHQPGTWPDTDTSYSSETMVHHTSLGTCLVVRSTVVPGKAHNNWVAVLAFDILLERLLSFNKLIPPRLPLFRFRRHSQSTSLPAGGRPMCYESRVPAASEPESTACSARLQKPRRHC